jgi:CO/xanthine dehydrogenase Mo-binding subunit
MYPADLAGRAELHAVCVRADVACARLDGIDIKAALRVSGVVRVLTAADVRGTNRFGLIVPDQPVLVEREIVGASDVVAVVIATTVSAAREGARHVRLSLSPRAGVFDPARALEVDAPAVHANRSNLLATRTIRRGDPDRAISRAPVVIEGLYRTGHVDHAFLAPEAGLAYVDDEGRLTIEVASQWPEADLRQAAAALGEPVERLRMVQATIGGAFGGREDISLQVLLLLAAREMRVPVHMAWDRAESVRGHGKRHPFIIHHTIGASRDGRLLAARVDCLLDAGCYASTSVKLLDNALVHITGPYSVRHVTRWARGVHEQPVHLRVPGFGVNQVTFAMEQQMNKLASAVGLDPAEVRARNLLRLPGTLGSGTRVRSLGGLAQTVTQAQVRGARKRLPKSREGLLYGRGLASGIKNVGYGLGFDDKATAEVTLTRRGAVVRVGAADVGQGVETVVAQIAAEELRLPVSRVVVEWRDSTVAPESGSTSSSRQTMAAGNAVLGACRRVVAARGRTPLPDEGVTRRYTWRFPKAPSLDARVGRHITTFSAGSCVADVAVDPETGQVRVLRVVSVIDAGRVVNPRLVRGQVEGGAVMGQGYALTEGCTSVEGLPVTRGFEGSGVPTAMDAVPLVESVVLESPEANGPLGARGIGEITMIPVVPAITAAIYDACGVWIDTLPASPEQVRDALAALNRASRGEA